MTQNPITPVWPRNPSDPVMQMLVPRLYGSTPTLFGAPHAATESDLKGAQVAFLGVPWRAPTPDSRMGRAAANYEGTLLTPSQFRANSLRHGGYLPELDIDVFSSLRFVDCGDVEIASDMGQLLATVEARVTAIVRAGCFPITLGGNAGPSTYPVLKAVAAHASGPTAVLNFDAHHDNHRGDWEEDDPKLPRWGSSWARRVLTLPGVDPAQYFHVGLRGTRNDREVFARFTDRGVRRERVTTYREIKQARRAGFESWAEHIARSVTEKASKVWIAFDPDVLNLGSCPDFGDEPLGPTTDEILEICFAVGKAAGPTKFGGIGMMAVPSDAQTLHSICVYLLLYTLAGVLQAEATQVGSTYELP
jgi:guanidinopropionase